MADADRAALLRKKIMDDPNVAAIAADLGMHYEAFVELCLDYALHPNKQPIFELKTDAQLRSEGYEPPSEAKIRKMLDERVKIVEITDKSKFADPNSQRERLIGAIPEPPAATAASTEVRQDLRQELEAELSAGKGKKI